MSDLHDEGSSSTNDTRWLNDETNALAEGIAESIATGSALPESAPSVGSPGASMAESPVHETKAPSIPFGARVTVKYAGSEYTFSMERTEPAELPEAVLKAIKTMKTGEKKLVSSSTSNSTQGSESASLVTSSDDEPTSMASSRDSSGLSTEGDHEVELINVEKLEHVVPGGTILKRRLYCPEETINDKHTPVFETVATVDMIGRVEATNEIFDERLDASFRIGESELGLGMERAIRTMHRGEKAEFTFLPPWAISLCEKPSIPGLDLKTTAVVYEVTLKSFVDSKTPFECHTYEDHLEEAQLRREQGVKAFDAKKFTLAIAKWTKAQLYLEQFNTFETPEQAQTYAQTKVLLATNLAAANLKLEEYDKVVLHCTNALEIEPKNAKSLYRRASAYVALKKFEQAKKDIVTLLEIEPESALGKHLLKRIDAQLESQAQEERQTYQRIFSALEDPAAKPLYEESTKPLETSPAPQTAPQQQVTAPAPQNKSSFGTLTYIGIALLVLLIAFLFTRS